VSSASRVVHRAPIVLIGFMGAGKSSVGPVLARRMGREFLDLDDKIEEREGRSIGDLFELGEATFRAAENAALRDALERASQHSMILALGGGAFVQKDNVQLLQGHEAISIFLDAPVMELWSRCRLQGKNRPLFQDENQFRQLYKTRRSSYMASSLLIDTRAKEVQSIADEIVQRIENEFGSQGE
jgi:shikimate kinase